MRFSVAFVLLPLATVTAVSRREDQSRLDQLRKEASAYVPRKYIVETSANTNLRQLSTRIKATGGKILKTFDAPGVFTGLSVETAEDVQALQAVSLVSRAWPVRRISLEPLIPAGFSDDAAAANYSVHAFTGVDKLHEEGILGKGARIAVVDTGIDYNHPALGGGFGPGKKVAGGFDLVGDDSVSEKPDPDPMDFHGHGTHVAGIVAGKSEFFSGVAPEAELWAYKVFGPPGGTDDETLIDAFLLAFSDGADVITASIGAVEGWSDNPWALVASRLVEQGVVVTISAGNTGDYGPFLGGSGSSGKNVISVASMDPKVKAAEPFVATFVLDGQSNTSALAYYPGRALWVVKDLPIVPVTLDTAVTADACSPLPSDTPDFTGAIALVRRGGCDFEVQQRNLEPFNARYVLFYNRDDLQLRPPVTTNANSSVAIIEVKAGVAIVETVKAGGRVTADFTYRGDWAVGAHNSAGGIPSSFTSWGTLNELESKPDIAAPGFEIYAPWRQNRYVINSGTSMACPYVAGVAALYISKHGGRSVHGFGFGKMLTDRIRSSGAALPWQLETPKEVPVNWGFWAPVPQVGGGLIDASKVLRYTTTLRFEPIALNDTAHFRRYHSVDITNGGTERVTYNFSLQPAGTVNAQGPEEDYIALLHELDPPYAFAPEVAFPGEGGGFTVEPGETRTAQFVFSPPVGLDSSRLPLYSGKILISGSSGEELSVPYTGLGTGLTEHFRRQDKLFPRWTPFQTSGPNGSDIATFHTYDFGNLSISAGANYPRLFVQVKWATRQLRWDIYEAGWRESSWRYPPGGQDGYVGSATTHALSDFRDWFDPDTMDKEDVLPFPITLSRSTRFFLSGFWWLGKLANGSYIAPGNYTFRFAALLPFGNPEHSDSWEIWETPEITVLPYTP